MESKLATLFDPDDNVVTIWKMPVPSVARPLRWNSQSPRPEKYACSLDVFGCIWLYDEQGLHFIEKNRADAQMMAVSVHLDSTVRRTDLSPEQWLKHWNFWKSHYRQALGANVLAFRKEEYNSQAWSSVCFVEQACIKLGVSVPPWPPKCNLNLYTNCHKFNIITKETTYPVRVWRSSTIRVLGVTLHVILARLNLVDSTIYPPGAFHGYIEVYDKIWEYGPRGLTCVLPEFSSPRKNATLMYTGYTSLTFDEWMKEWRHFETNTSFKSNDYSLFEVNCLTFLTYALNALGVERTKEIQGLSRWMRQFLRHGKRIRVPGIGIEFFAPPLSWVLKVVSSCGVPILTILSYYGIRSYLK